MSDTQSTTPTTSTTSIVTPTPITPVAPTPTTPTTPKRLSPSLPPSEPKDKIVTDPDNLYVFIGGEAQIGVTRLTGYGMQVRIKDFTTLEEALCGGIAIVPKSQWDKVGFTDDELEKYSQVETHNADDADLTFMRKVLVTRDLYDKFAHPIIDAQKFREHLDSVKRAEQSGNSARERQAALMRLLQEFNPAYPQVKLKPQDMLDVSNSNSNRPASSDFEPMKQVIEVVEK